MCALFSSPWQHLDCEAAPSFQCVAATTTPIPRALSRARDRPCTSPRERRPAPLCASEISGLVMPPIWGACTARGKLFRGVLVTVPVAWPLRLANPESMTQRSANRTRAPSGRGGARLRFGRRRRARKRASTGVVEIGTDPACRWSSAKTPSVPHSTLGARFGGRIPREGTRMPQR